MAENLESNPGQACIDLMVHTLRKMGNIQTVMEYYKQQELVAENRLRRSLDVAITQDVLADPLAVVKNEAPETVFVPAEVAARLRAERMLLEHAEETYLQTQLSKANGLLLGQHVTVTKVEGAAFPFGRLSEGTLESGGEELEVLQSVSGQVTDIVPEYGTMVVAEHPEKNWYISVVDLDSPKHLPLVTIELVHSLSS